jgi:hypothetical protein
MKIPASASPMRSECLIFQVASVRSVPPLHIPRESFTRLALFLQYDIAGSARGRRKNQLSVFAS